jgi:zeaxanthin glucosyltransferase
VAITTDQPGMAARVARVGAGEVVPLAKLDAAKLKSAIERVLTEPSYRDNARKLCEAIDRAGGVKYAADIVDRVLQTNSPALNNSR